MEATLSHPVAAASAGDDMCITGVVEDDVVHLTGNGAGENATVDLTGMSSDSMEFVSALHKPR